jgi:hypothetical protein
LAKSVASRFEFFSHKGHTEQMCRQLLSIVLEGMSDGRLEDHPTNVPYTR